MKPTTWASRLAALTTQLTMSLGIAFPVGSADLDAQVGRPADLAPSAYVYRADRDPADNAPESWLALMRYAGQPLNRPVDPETPAIRQVLSALLWEEIRPIRRIELSWPANDRPIPTPEELEIVSLDHQGTASSWWNNLAATTRATAPVVSADGRTYTYQLPVETCGLLTVVTGTRRASEFAVPMVRAFGAETWKKMALEIEWGFSAGTTTNDYGGRIEVYDGQVDGLGAIAGDPTTQVTGSSAWRSSGIAFTGESARRGLKAELLYLGTSKWRREQPFTSQADDVARTIVTVWTRAGAFSFLAGDLENGPILAPEYGFFVRRTSPIVRGDPGTPPPDRRTSRMPLDDRMASIAGNPALRGWGSDQTPWFGGNPTDQPQNAQGIAFPPRTLGMHPGSALDVAVAWRSPIRATVRIEARVAHAQNGSNGIEWWLERETARARTNLARGATEGAGSLRIPVPGQPGVLDEVPVEIGDLISLVVGPKGAHSCDTTLVEFRIADRDGAGRSWDLTSDVVGSLTVANPHADSHGASNVWHFYAERPVAPSPVPSQPPIELASAATGAREYLRELESRNLGTVRRRIRAHREQTWDEAVAAMRGPNLPPHPLPPPEYRPTMEVRVPSARLTAQWNLGTWHLLRHAQKHPRTGRLWFSDHPYGILGAETYLVLAALDAMGSHPAAGDGFEQWVSLPMDSRSTDHPGHHEWALPDRPNGLFSEGHGCLTHAVGPPGVGGHMDGVHAFGPGSIGWALIEHYRLTGDAEWLRKNLPRMKANAEWMLRQRRTVRDMVPGGDRLWCRGLQPALQVTPDSGGLWMQFYECEAYYWVAVAHLAEALFEIDPTEGTRLKAEAEAYRRDLLAAVERSIALSPVVPVRDGTFHSVIPFACYVRGLSTGAWGWQRDGSGSHVGPLYWETVQSAAALISPARLLVPDDVRVQGYLDVLEDRLLLENPYVGGRDWFAAGWQYQGGLERTANMHLEADDIPVFLRSFLNAYAIDILPHEGYIFNEHAVHGPPDKIFEEAAFLERFRNLLAMEQGEVLWIARGTPRAWLEQGQTITVRQAPTHFGPLAYEIVSDVHHGRITATVEIPSRRAPRAVWLRLRHPKSAPIRSVVVNGESWRNFDATREIVRLEGLSGTVGVTVGY